MPCDQCRKHFSLNLNRVKTSGNEVVTWILPLLKFVYCLSITRLYLKYNQNILTSFKNIAGMALRLSDTLDQKVLYGITVRRNFCDP